MLFRSKVFPRIEPQAALLAYVTGRPVKFVLRRDEEFVTLTRHATVVTIRLGLKRDGRITAKEVRAYWNTGAYADCGPDVARKGGFGIVGPYRIPNVAVDSRCVYTNLPPAGAFRGYAVTQATWASESMMDLAADALGLDPLEFRLRNLLRDGETFATGENFGVVQTRGLTASLSAPLTPAITGVARAFYRENEFTGVGGGPADTTEETWGGSLGFSVQILRWLNMGLDYTHRRISASARGGEIVENLARVSFTAAF